MTGPNPFVAQGDTRTRAPRLGPRGRITTPEATAAVVAVLDAAGLARPVRDLLIEQLHALQDAGGGCLREGQLVALAAFHRLAPVEIFETVSFYAHFEILPDDAPAPPPVTLRVCEGLPCMMAGAGPLLQAVRDAAPAGARVVGAPCMGACHRAPMAAVGFEPVAPATAEALCLAARHSVAGAACPPGLTAYRARDGHAALRAARDGALTSEAMLAALERSGLRGLGGAGFPVARKWRFALSHDGPRHLVVNADEGEPGTFKDRFCLETEPHRVLEGMLLAAHAIDASACWIYIRDEYPDLRCVLAAAIGELRAAGAVSMPVHLRRGAGAYICGEETALLESLEGRRGYPRHKPPFPGQYGLFGQPTVIHNVETLWWLPDILSTADGADRYAAAGRRGAKGERLFSVSGRVRHPGVKRAPIGVTARELIEDFSGGMAEGHRFLGYLPGGASGGILPANLADLPLDIGTLDTQGCFVGSGAVVVLSDQDDLADVARNLLRFFRDESCGQCTPCRVGTAKAARLLEAPAWDRALLGELAQAMADGSICGLGQAAMNPVRSLLRFFPGAGAVSPIRFTLDGAAVEAAPGETIWAVAKRLGVEIPHLCHLPRPGYRPDGNCRACVVEVEGERVLAASCCRAPTPGMVVRITSPSATHARRMVFELLLADMPQGAARDEGATFARWARQLGVTASRFAPEPARSSPDLSHPAMAVQLDACIACGLCARACREVQHNDVIGFAHRGLETRVSFDLLDPMGASSCVGCGECVEACPTGALMPKSVLGADGRRAAPPAAEVASVCPYCGVGCQVGFRVRDNRIEEVVGRDGPANQGRLCVKGRFGFDYLAHPDRLTTPLIRIEGAPKDPADCLDPARAQRHFREASWEEALDRAAQGLVRIRDGARGPAALAGFGSAKGSNEEAYLFQKLVRTGFGTNNVDHCTRLCHAASVAALLEDIGSAAVTAPFTAAAEAELLLVIGARPTENHPVAATFLKDAVARGAKLIVMDPRGTGLDRFATEVVRFAPGQDVALLNAIMHVILEEELYDTAFVAARVEGLAELRAHLAGYAPEAMERLCGVKAAQLRRVARLYAGAKSALTLWGMGVSQSVHGTDNARALIALALLCGYVGREGAGLHPLRGQNNVQGASDAGLIPMMLPDYRRTEDPATRQFLEELWGARLDPAPGLTVVEILQAAERGEIRGMYVMGENPAMSDPDVAHARAALARLDHLVVQDLFLTETAALADVVLPGAAWPEKDGTVTNTNRQVQMGHAAVSPPGKARQDLQIIADLARRLGLEWQYPHARDVFAEMAQAMPSLTSITWARLEREGSVTYPCAAPDSPGEDIVFRDMFPTASGKARLVPAGLSDPGEMPDAAYPFVLTTGRQLEHWHTGAMTRRARVLDALEPSPTVSLAPADLRRLGLASGQRLRVVTRRGAVELLARADPGLPDGLVFIPFAYREAAANLLTDPRLDPDGKIPGFKYCAARLEPTDLQDSALGV